MTEEELKAAYMDWFRKGVPARGLMFSAFKAGHAAAQPKWLPIETAPKDGSLMLLAATMAGPTDWRIKVGGYRNNEWNCFGASWTPTHYMQLPAPPEQKE